MIRPAPDAEPVKGVSFDPRPGGHVLVNPTLVWRARVALNGQEKTLGRFATVAEANDAITAYRAVLDALVVRCTRQERAGCPGCKGLRLRTALTLLELL